MGSLFSERNHIVMGLAPVADAFAGTVYSDVVDVTEANGLMFEICWGVGATGTGTITVEACDNTTPSTTSAVAFKSQRVADHTSSDVPGAVTARTSAGFATTAGSNQKYLIHVDPDVIASTGYRYARLKWVEVVDSPILGFINVIQFDLRTKRYPVLSAID